MNVSDAATCIDAEAVTRCISEGWRLTKDGKVNSYVNIQADAAQRFVLHRCAAWPTLLGAQCASASLRGGWESMSGCSSKRAQVQARLGNVMHERMVVL